MKSPNPARLAYSRRERKFPLQQDAWENLMESVRRRLPVERFDGAHDVVRVRTTYLDTADLASFREYVEKRPVRKKVRIRQYGYEDRFDDRCWVEIKIKRYRQSLKRRFCCCRDQLAALMDGHDIRGHVLEFNAGSTEAEGIYREARALIVELGLRPLVRVEYDRMSFQDGASSKMRVTLDRNIRLGSAEQREMSPFDGIVLEVKHAGPEPDSIRELLGEMNLLRSGRFSKFALAVRTVNAQESWRRCSA